MFLRECRGDSYFFKNTYSESCGVVRGVCGGVVVFHVISTVTGCDLMTLT
jgi:hypothetical protein